MSVSILGVEEGDDSVTDVAEELVKLLLGVEAIALVEGCVIVAHVLEDLLVEVVAQGRHYHDYTAHEGQGLQYFAHLTSASTTSAIELIIIIIICKQ